MVEAQAQREESLWLCCYRQVEWTAGRCTLPSNIREEAEAHPQPKWAAATTMEADGAGAAGEDRRS